MTTVLVIDDSTTIRKSVGIVLKNYNFTIFEAADGPTGLDIARAQKPDLILLDINITPDMDGFTVLKHLKADDVTKDIPVIMLTSCSENVDVVKAVKLGAVDYVVKPFIPKKLVQKVFLRIEARKVEAT